MDVQIYSKAADFLSQTGDLLRSDEARYSLIYGIARLVDANPHHYGEEDPLFCTVDGNNGISALAWRTPPYPVGLAWNANDPEKAVLLLIEAIHSRWAEIPGVAGHREVTDPFAYRWCKDFGTSIESTMAQRIYRLDSVDNVPPIPGRMRPATPADTDLVSAWTRSFMVEVGTPTHQNIPERDFTPSIEKGLVYLWEYSENPVSMVMKDRPTGHAMSVTLVYTPPELRRNGYATACVAGVCRDILKSGYDFCTLYADLSNPTSNSIYMKIGFRPVCDSVEYALSPPL
ncbi:MAG: GNAT family N-acetyltransferase [Promethearchaeati archaeon]